MPQILTQHSTFNLVLMSKYYSANQPQMKKPARG